MQQAACHLSHGPQSAASRLAVPAPAAQTARAQHTQLALTTAGAPEDKAVGWKTQTKQEAWDKACDLIAKKGETE